MHISESNNRYVEQFNLNKASGDNDLEELDEKIKKMKEMMSSMEQLHESMKNTLYLQIFLAPEEKKIEW